MLNYESIKMMDVDTWRKSIENIHLMAANVRLHHYPTHQQIMEAIATLDGTRTTLSIFKTANVSVLSLLEELYKTAKKKFSIGKNDAERNASLLDACTHLEIDQDIYQRLFAAAIVSKTIIDLNNLLTIHRQQLAIIESVQELISSKSHDLMIQGSLLKDEFEAARYGKPELPNEMRS